MSESKSAFPIVGIGASAGGVEALQSLFRAMPEPLDMAFVIVTHLGPNHESALPAILRECTATTIVAARDGQPVEAGHAYVLPSDAIITIAGGHLVLRAQDVAARRERQPIDVFLASLAADQGEWAVGIVLSGSGSDGTLGLKAIKECGGLTFAQGTDGTAPRYPEMAASAVAGGTVDLLVPVEDIPARLIEFARGMRGLATTTDDDVSGQRAKWLATTRATICGVLRQRLGHDFSGYKDGTFFRRVQRRSQILRLAGGLDAYVAYLEQHPDEAGHLFRDLLIGVTGFFRDNDAFAVLTDRIIPALFDKRGVDDTVRVWVPGCATGEEAYSLAILLREYQAAHPDGLRVQVFATDIDEAALGVARVGRYPAGLMTGISAERLARNFHVDGAAYKVVKELRELCVFSSHSVIRDAPFSRIDLVSCRNLLIYMGGQLQEQVISLFHYALRPGGFLFLGISETMARHAHLFAAEDRAHRVFRRRQHPNMPQRVPLLPQGVGRSSPTAPPRRPSRGGGSELRLAAETYILEQFAPAHVVVDAEGDVVHQSARLGKYLEPATGTPSSQLLAMARRGLRIDLRAALREAVETRRAAQRSHVKIDLDDRTQTITLTVAPLPAGAGGEPLFLVLFTDRGAPESKSDLAEVHPEAVADGMVLRLERDLRDAREGLQTAAEEYETATEELRSANEEMAAVNEELQSTNEELETSKEELQAVNEELRAANHDMTEKVDALDRSNADLRNLFDSTQIATIFLDRFLTIRSFTPAVTAIFNLIPSDTGRPLADFASQLDSLDLPSELRRVLDSSEPIERRVTARDGIAHYLMRLLPYRATGGATDGVVLTFFDVTRVVEAEVLGTLVDELNHRVRNMLQVVLAVASSTLRRSPSLEAFKDSFEGRLRALSRAHELVSLMGWGSVPLLDLVRKELLPYVEGDERLAVNGPPVALRPKAALSFGMVLHELATNAAKHGALSSELGRVAVDWAIEGGPEAAGLVLRWTETGGPPVSPTPERRGFGSELIERQMRHDLGGTTTFEFAAGGLRAVLTLSMAALAATTREAAVAE